MPVTTIVLDAYGTLYDVQSVAAITDEAFPGHGGTITQIWRLKQLEYTWLRSMMGRFENFAHVTRESLAFTLETLGLTADTATFDRLIDAYDHLTPYPEAAEALGSLSQYRVAILSNGSEAMLSNLVKNSGLASHFAAVISVDEVEAFKPDPRAYTLVEKRLGASPADVLFVSSNGFDIAGAKSFGFRVARVERVPAATITAELTSGAPIGPAAMFRALRTRSEHLGYAPDTVLASLRELPGAAAAIE